MIDRRVRLERAQRFARLRLEKEEKINVEIGNAERFAIRGEEMIAGELETRDGRFVGVFELEKRAAAADVEELHDAGLAADGHLHAVVAEANGARLRVEDLHALQAVATARVVALHLAWDFPTASIWCTGERAILVSSAQCAGIGDMNVPCSRSRR